MRTTLSLFLAVSLGVGATAAACGGSPGAGPAVPDNGSASAAPSTPPTDSAPTPVASSSTTAAPTSAPTASVGPVPSGMPGLPPLMKPPKATAMGDKLKAIGLDVKNLPSMDTMVKSKKKELRQVMAILSESTGYKCKECHDADDFAKPTAKKSAATHMWDAWSRGLTFSDGSPLFCDSCHQGQQVVLDRSDKKSLAKWMQASYVDPLARKDKKDVGCATCHGDDMDMHFLSTWEKK